MATYNKFTDFLVQLGKGIHHFQTAGDVFKMYLTNQQPVAGNTIKADIPEIAIANGYATQTVANTNWVATTGGKYGLVGDDVTFGAASGVIGPFRWAVLYNDTATNDPLIAWWEYGPTSISLQIGESFKVDFGPYIFDVGPELVMPSTGDVICTVGENVTGIGAVSWVNPGNITIADGTYSTCNLGAGQTSNYLRARAFGLSIPANSQIVGCTVKAALVMGGGSGNINAWIVDEHGIFTISNSIPVSGGAVYTWGGSADLWGETSFSWSDDLTHITNVAFGVQFHCPSSGRNVSVDWVTIALEYVPGTIVLLADAYTYAFNGEAATLLKTVIVTQADTRTFPFTGYNATLAKLLTIMQANSRTFPFTGYDAGYLRPLRIMPALESVTFVFLGYDATLSAGHIFSVDSYTYPFTGYDTVLSKISPSITEIVMPALPHTYKYNGSIGCGLQKIPIRIEYGVYVPGDVPDITFIAPVPPDFTLTKVAVNTVTGGTAVPLVPNDRDHILNTITGGTTTIEYQLSTSLIPLQYRAENPAVATVNGSGKVNYVSTGLARIIADCAQSSKGVFCNMNRLVIPTNAYAFVDWVPGSLAYKLAHDYDALIAGTTRAINGQLISQWTPLKRNMNNWAIRAGVDMTPLGMINSTSYAKGQLTLITPRHCITAEHNKVHSGPGHWAQWLAQDGTDRICQRDLVSDIMCQYPPPAAPGLYFDLRVYLLDSDVDGYIGHVKFLPPPSVYSPRLPSIKVTDVNESTGTGSLAYWLPLVIQDQRKFANCQEWSATQHGIGYDYLLQSVFRAPQVGSPRYEYIVAPGPPNYEAGKWSFGDSGSARSLIYNNQLVLQSTVSEIAYDNLIPTLQNAIDTLGNPDNYQIERVDWSSWPTFPIG